MQHRNGAKATIAVFGSSLVQPTDAEYRAAVDVGRALGQAGYAVMTGGYGGIMQAASEGAADAGAHVIGVTITRSALGSEREINAHVTENIIHQTMRDRLHHLVEQADGYVVMNGGIGTLQELAETWQLLRIGSIHPRPLVCYGPFWRQIIMPLIESAYVPPAHAAWIRFADTPDAVIDCLKS